MNDSTDFIIERWN